jgi:hypothetical protein
MRNDFFFTESGAALAYALEAGALENHLFSHAPSTKSKSGLK